MGWGSFTSSIRRSVRNTARSVSGAAQDAGKQASANLLDASVYPIEFTAQQLGRTISAIRPVAAQTTQLIQENPALAGALGGLVPGLGGFFGSGAQQSAQQYTPPEPPNNTLLIVGGLAVAGIIAIMIARK